MDIEFELRPIKDSDLDALVKYADDPGVAGNLTNRFPNPYTKEDGIRFIKFAQSDGPEHIMAISVNNEFSGAIGIHPMSDIFSRNAELGYWLARPYWGKGIMTTAI
ncbi:MAG: GNAT family N-acetyltransferase, partial [Saprospiraceae bacterium]|nr:GNAT family N-acetyltransferase [Saprospiraceae bacterium]